MLETGRPVGVGDGVGLALAVAAGFGWGFQLAAKLAPPSVLCLDVVVAC